MTEESGILGAACAKKRTNVEIVEFWAAGLRVGVCRAVGGELAVHCIVRYINWIII
jgi:hypothetical protein